MAYKVKNGDTLSAIAKNNNTTVEEIVKMNPSIKNPNLIYAGTEINLPSSGAASSVPASAGSTSLKGNHSTRLQSNIPGVSNETYTAMNEKFTDPESYTPYMAKVESYLQQLENINNDSSELDAIKDQINNRDKFSYDFASDPMFQNMLASYQQMGQSAMKDSVAQSVALTGGYANSWAQTAGQQSYNRHIQEAFNNLPSYYQMALETYRQEGQDLLDKYNVTASERNRQIQEIANLYNMTFEQAKAVYDIEWNKYVNRVDKAYQLGNMEQTGYWNDKNYKYQMEQDAIANARADKQLEAEQKQLEVEQKQWEAKMLADGYTLDANGNWTQPEETFEYDGPLYQYLRDGDDGEKIFRNLDSDEEIALPAGTNPYGAPSNDDTAHGTFSNGYQPNNIDGQHLEKAGAQIIVNGKTQNVWEKEGSGDWYYWDGFTGQYHKVDKEDDRILK